MDEKGRLAVPSRFRDELGSHFVVTKGLDGCLFAYPLTRWKELEEKLRHLPLSSAEARAFLRFFFAGAAEVEVDRQGRILVPQLLRDYAHLQQNVAFLGVAERCEIWSAPEWERYQQTQDASPEDIAAKLGDLGVFGV